MESSGCDEHLWADPGCAACALPGAGADLHAWRAPVYRLVEAAYRLEEENVGSQENLLLLAQPYLTDSERRLSATISAAIFLHATESAGREVLGTDGVADEVLESYIMNAVVPVDVGMAMYDLREALVRGSRAEVSAVLDELGAAAATGLLLALCAAGGALITRIASRVGCAREELFALLTNP